MIRDLFTADVTRDIPPVIYFHEQSPDKLRDEVSEYIITGGYPKAHPHHRRVPRGIHEELLRLLTAIHKALGRPGGPELPASWISGFYGSGKSSFAKLLGLSLNGTHLPDGVPLCDALLRRDTSPRAAELREAWDALITQVDPIACVFDIGGQARDNEHVHSAVVRQVQKRLGYCPDALVADFELRLERDGDWDRFVEEAHRTLDGTWEEAMQSAFADDDFSEVLHKLRPDQYQDPQSWIRSRAGTADRALSSDEAVSAIADMLEYREPDKTLFLVVDEVSQYIHQESQRMLKLQSFVSALGQRLRGRVWLLVTGQEKLEEESEATVIGKMKDRFPPALRVHLATTNIRDVVHRRLLEKRDDQKEPLRELYRRNRANLRLYAYRGEEIAEEDFVDVYPMLPGHIDLLMQITTAMRTRSSRVQGDDHAIRGLLQLLGELFRTRRLADAEVGALVTLDAIFDVQQTALDSDVQTTLHRLFEHCEREEEIGATPQPPSRGATLAARAGKAVALLELIQDQEPTTAKLVAACLYDRLDRGDQEQAVTGALERLRFANLLGYSEKHGYKVQSSAAQEWEKERRDIGVTPEQQSELCRGKLEFAIAKANKPEIAGVPLPWAAFFSDDRRAKEERLVNPRKDAAATVDFRLVPAEARGKEIWVARTSVEPLDRRVVWVVGESEQTRGVARELGKSQGMLARYRPRRDSLTRDKQRLLFEEEARADDLDRTLQDAVEAAWMDGSLYFAGQQYAPRDLSAAFSGALEAAATRALPEVYPHFVSTTITETELAQLLADTISGASSKFLEGELGIVSLDAGRYMATCGGRVPASVLKYVEQQTGAAGSTLFGHFGRPPYGYTPALIRACVAGLLRGGKIRIRPKSGAEITSVKDPGAKDLFRRESDLRAADIFAGGGSGITGKDRVRIAKLFRETLGIDIERENDAIADAVYQHFPGRAAQLREVEAALNRLPGAPPTPKPLLALHKALEDGRRSRQVEPTVKEVKRHIDALRDGLPLLAAYACELDDAAVAKVRAAGDVMAHHVAQLHEVGQADAVAPAVGRVEATLATERPWQGIATIDRELKAIRVAYHDARQAILARHGEQVERVQGQLRQRPGFSRLPEPKAIEVLQAVTDALLETQADAIAPALADLDGRFLGRLDRAEDEANERLDRALEALNRKPVVKVRVRLQNRVLTGPDDLDGVILDLRKRVGEQLAQGKHVRLV